MFLKEIVKPLRMASTRKTRFKYILLYLACGVSLFLVHRGVFGRDKRKVDPLAVKVNSLSSINHDERDSEEFIHADPMVHTELCVNKSFSYSTKMRGIKKKNIFYCSIPKVASTFTTGLLSRIPKCQKDGYCFDRDSLRQGFKPSKTSFSFMWVREPYSRLFSAFENKLFTPNDFWQKLGRQVILRTRKIPSERSVILGHDVTFAELVRDVLDMTSSNTEINQHLQPMHTFCNPCKVKYDFVGKMENFTTAVGQVCDAFRRIGLLDGTKMKNSCNDIVPEKSMFSRVKKLFLILRDNSNDLSPKEKLAIMDRTWRSYQIRGVMLNNLKMPFSEKNVGEVTFTKYCQALNESLTASAQNETDLKNQRQEALVQAYTSVPLRDMERLKNFVRRDCELFGYDLEPEYLFQPRDIKYDGFDYFGGLLAR